jgi:hypothetical protein
MRSTQNNNDRVTKTAEQSRSGATGMMWRRARWVASLPLRYFPSREIGENAGLIRSLFQAATSRPYSASGLIQGDGKSFDLAATAFTQGISIWELEKALARRQQTTAIVAYIAFALGWLCFIALVYRLLEMDWNSGSVLTALEFAPLCVAFFLYAFKTALQNNQIRTRRLVTAREYLSANDRFWPG